MAFRDETDALRAKVGALEKELAEAHRRIEELEGAGRERDALQKRVEQLEAQLGKAAPRTPRDTTKWLRPVAIVVPLVALVAVAYGTITEVLDRSLEGDPVHGMVDLALHPSPPLLSAETRGTIEASRLGEGCRGFLPDAPHVVLRASEPTRVRLWTDAPEDTVLAVRTGDGTAYCDDDSGTGQNASLDVVLPAGDHRVWVGTYGEDNVTHFELGIAAGDDPIPAASGPVLAPSADPTLGAVRVEGPAFARVLSGRASGLVRAEAVQTGCRGYVRPEPHVRLLLSEPRAVRLWTTSPTDLVLMVRRPDGTFLCDDDSAGSLQPRIGGTFSAGPHEIWIGTYSEGGDATFELSLEADEGVDPTGLAPDATPRLGELVLGAEPVAPLRGEARGTTPAALLGYGCTGFVPVVPDATVTLAEPREVWLRAASAPDVVLLVQSPDGGRRCIGPRDDPSTWSTGTHRVWVGTPGPNEAVPYTLFVGSGAAAVVVGED